MDIDHDTNDHDDDIYMNSDSTTTTTTYNCLQLINYIDEYFKSSDIIKPVEENNESNNRTAYFCFPCIACSSNFTHDQTLQLHLDRRTVYIRVYCMKCDIYKTFFNPCKLLYHIYSHKNELLEPLYKHLSIETIPIEKLHVNKQKKFDLDTIDLVDLTHDDLNNLDKFQVKLKENNNKCFKCLICDAIFFTTNDLKQHYQQSKQLYLQSINEKDLEETEYMDKSTIESLQRDENLLKAALSRNLYLNHVENAVNLDDSQCFNIQRLKYASRCNLIANLNFIYNKFTPFAPYCKSSMMYICPECGLCFDQLDIFQNHLLSQCFYSIRNFRLKCICKNCDFICKSKQLYIKHYTEKHIKRLQYCLLCDNKGVRVYFSKENTENVENDSEDDTTTTTTTTTPTAANNNEDTVIEAHFNEKHPEESKLNYVKLIYACDCSLPSECTFETWKLCRKHYIQKLNKWINYISCFICQKNFHYLKYNQHLQASHKIKQLIYCNQCDYVTDGSNTFDEHLNQAHNDNNKENPCLNLVKISTKDYLYQCFKCKLFFSTNCNFSHNCMENEIIKNNNINQKSNQINYFSPIYIKFNSSIKYKDPEDDDKLMKYERELFSPLLIQQNSTTTTAQQPDIIEIDDTKPTSLKQQQKCDVCFKKFPDEYSLNRHIRSHGLYFFKTKHYLKYFEEEEEPSSSLNSISKKQQQQEQPPPKKVQQRMKLNY